MGDDPVYLRNSYCLSHRGKLHYQTLSTVFRGGVTVGLFFVGERILLSHGFTAVFRV